MFRLTVVLIVAFAATCTNISKSFAQLQKVEFSELDSLQKVQQKEVVVFIHTEWCTYCHQMKNTTFMNDSVVNLLNTDFYFVELDAECKDDIIYAGRIFKYKPSGLNTGVHELAEQLGTIDGKLNYPTISIVNTKNEIVFQYRGLLNSKALKTVLKNL